MKLRFGTDGVRGKAFDELSVADAVQLGEAAAAVLGGDRAVIAHDTRASGPQLVAGLAAGFARGNVAAEFMGVAPTPAVAHMAATDNIVGAMVSASHNPWFDNGIKFFAPGGRKLSDAEQSAMEAAVAGAGPVDGPIDTAATIATMTTAERRVGDWAQSLKATVAPGALAGLSVVLDCANGAGSHIAAPVLADLGADVTVMANQPTGRNINDNCGSTHPEALAEVVVTLGADIGLALDGDADRLLAVDNAGELVDGDHIIAMCANDRHQRGALVDDTVVVTVMTNLGFRLAMQERGIHVAETPVGDRHVLEALEVNGWSIGGEQSGHVIFPELATTGDGLLTGIQLLDTLKRSGRSIADLAAASMTQLPQVLQNVTVATKVPDVAEQLAAEIDQAAAGLGERGRILVRPSGTEPVIRVMVEAPTADLAEATCTTVSDAVRARFAQ